MLLSGDVHRSEFRLTPRSADGGYDLPEIVSSPLANGGSLCGFDDQLIDCFVGSSYFVTLDIDTSATDPTLLATIWDQYGVLLADWLILRSELELP